VEVKGELSLFKALNSNHCQTGRQASESLIRIYLCFHQYIFDTLLHTHNHPSASWVLLNKFKPSTLLFALSQPQCPSSCNNGQWQTGQSAAGTSTSGPSCTSCCRFRLLVSYQSSSC
jgi:hypothetical protein